MIIMNSLQCGSHIAALWVGYDVWSVYCSVMSPAFEEAFAISNFLLDLWILLLPLPNVSFRVLKLRKRDLVIGV